MSELTKEDEYGIISRTMMNIRSLRVFAREVARNAGKTERCC